MWHVFSFSIIPLYYLIVLWTIVFWSNQFSCLLVVDRLKWNPVIFSQILTTLLHWVVSTHQTVSHEQPKEKDASSNSSKPSQTFEPKIPCLGILYSIFYICSNNESKHFAFKYHHWIITLRLTKGDIGTCYWQLTGLRAGPWRAHWALQGPAQDPRRAPWALRGSSAIGGTRVLSIAESSGGQDCQGKVEGRGLVEAWFVHRQDQTATKIAYV